MGAILESIVHFIICPWFIYSWFRVLWVCSAVKQFVTSRDPKTRDSRESWQQVGGRNLHFPFFRPDALGGVETATNRPIKFYITITMTLNLLNLPAQVNQAKKVAEFPFKTTFLLFSLCRPTQLIGQELLTFWVHLRVKHLRGHQHCGTVIPQYVRISY